MTSLWADEQVSYPLEVEPYTPEKSFPKGKNDPAFARNSKWPGNWPKGLLSKDGLSVPLWQIISTERIAV